MYEDYTVIEYMNAAYKGDRSRMDNETFLIVETEFIDTAKMYEEEEFNKVSYIHFLNGRINTIKLSIKLQRDFLDNFDSPYIPGFKKFNEFGYSLYWKGDNKQFLDRLKVIEGYERRYVTEVENCIKLLIEFRASKNSGEQPVKITRQSFIKTVNILGKQGFKIDNYKTSMEELALMIVQQKEENKR